MLVGLVIGFHPEDERRHIYTRINNRYFGNRRFETCDYIRLSRTGYNTNYEASPPPSRPLTQTYFPVGV